MISVDQLVNIPIKVLNLPNSCTVQSRLLVFFILARYADRAPCEGYACWSQVIKFQMFMMHMHYVGKDRSNNVALHTHKFQEI